MNSPVARWLLNLDVIPDDAEGLRLVWLHHWPLWLWILLVLAAVGISAWSYSRLNGRISFRAVLATIRCTLLVVLMAILSGPMIQQPRELVEPDYAILLLDRSESMNVSDVGGPEHRVSRDDQLRSILTRHRSMFARMQEDRRVAWMGFHSGVFDLSASSDDLPIEPGPASGRETSLARSIEQALQRSAGRPISGVVVFSDGRTTDPPTGALVRRLQAEALPVIVFPLGSDQPATDLAIGAVDLPRRAFIRDEVPVVVRIDRAGSAAGALQGEVRLVDEASGEIMDRLELPSDPETGTVILRARPEHEGAVTWKVVLQTVQEDLIPDNNHRLVHIELMDRPLSVLYVEGYPRWEYRYLKNLLVRERSIECSILLLSADREFAQEGNRPITRFPATIEELEAYDVIVLGDVPGQYFTPDQASMMLDYIAGRGGGLLWIGGERWTPAGFAGTALTDLLPIRGSLDLPRIGEPVNMQPTETAEEVGVLRLTSAEEIGWPAALADPDFGWSRLQWAQRIEPGRLKPTAEVLARTAQLVGGVNLPLVLSLRYGAGQSVYVATDEVWRWRHGRGEHLPEQFWLQLIRMLGREGVWHGADRAAISVRPRQGAIGRPMRAELRLLDARLTDEKRATVAAVLETDEGVESARVEMSRVEGTEERYAAVFLPHTTGRLRLRIDDPSFPDLQAEAQVEVYAADDELRRPETDHALLHSLAEATGGRVLTDRTLATLPDLLPNRAIRTMNPLRESIWDSPLTFIVLLILLTSEWVGRKIMCFA